MSARVGRCCFWGVSGVRFFILSQGRHHSQCSPCTRSAQQPVETRLRHVSSQLSGCSAAAGEEVRSRREARGDARRRGAASTHRSGVARARLLTRARPPLAAARRRRPQTADHRRCARVAPEQLLRRLSRQRQRRRPWRLLVAAAAASAPALFFLVVLCLVRAGRRARPPRQPQ